MWSSCWNPPHYGRTCNPSGLKTPQPWRHEAAVLRNEPQHHALNSPPFRNEDRDQQWVKNQTNSRHFQPISIFLLSSFSLRTLNRNDLPKTKFPLYVSDKTYLFNLILINFGTKQSTQTSNEIKGKQSFQCGAGWDSPEELSVHCWPGTTAHKVTHEHCNKNNTGYNEAYPCKTTWHRIRLMGNNS